MIGEYIARIKGGSLERFVMKDFLQNCLWQSSLAGHILTQKEIFERALMFCDEAEIPSHHAMDFQKFYANEIVLEPNTVYHGDCRDILPLLKPNKPKGIVSDFPYGVDFQSNNRKATAKFNKILNDKEPFIDKWIEQSYNILQDGGFLLTSYRWDVQDLLFNEIERVGFEIKNQLIWLKGAHGMGDLEGSFGEAHELFVFAVKGRFKFPKRVGRPTNILPAMGGSAASNSLVHPNEKPLFLMRHLIETCTEPGDLVIDPFSGSGKTCEAAVSIGRLGIGIELDDRIVDKIGMNYVQWGNKCIQKAKGGSGSLF